MSQLPNQRFDGHWVGVPYNLRDKKYERMSKAQYDKVIKERNQEVSLRDHPSFKRKAGDQNWWQIAAQNHAQRPMNWQEWFRLQYYRAESKLNAMMEYRIAQVISHGLLGIGIAVNLYGYYTLYHKYLEYISQ